MPTNDIVHTPWGVADHETVLAEGITFYGTPSHGGFRLDAGRNARVHPALRETDGWYEEDCAWAKVAFTFAEAFSAKDREAAIRTLKEWYPDEYETVTGIILAPGESRTRDERLFLERHVNDWIVISAITSDQHPGMVACVATRGGVRPAWGKPRLEQRHYLVPETEYRQRGRFGFVIDPGRHAPCDGPSGFVMRG